MASNSESSLNTAINAVTAALDRLEAGVVTALAERNQSAAARETIQSELTASWETHSTRIEAELTEAQEENSYLKEDNQRLSNQLQQLQQDYLDLQTTASGTAKKLDRSVKQLDLILEQA